MVVADLPIRRPKTLRPRYTTLYGQRIIIEPKKHLVINWNDYLRFTNIKEETGQNFNTIMNYLLDLYDQQQQKQPTKETP